MLAHVSIGVGDLDRAKEFYEAALAPLEYRCIRAAQSMPGWGFGRDSIGLWLLAAERPVPPDGGSGLHLCFAAPSPAAVDAFHVAALRAGGRDNGAPGPCERYGPNYYAAFVIDPDGYRIEAFYGHE